MEGEGRSSEEGCTGVDHEKEEIGQQGKGWIGSVTLSREEPRYDPALDIIYKY